MRKLTSREADIVSDFIQAADAWEALEKRLSSSVLKHAPDRSWSVYVAYMSGLLPRSEAWVKHFRSEYLDHNSSCPVCRDCNYCSEGVWMHGQIYYAPTGMNLYEFEWMQDRLGGAHRLARKVLALHKKLAAIPAEALKGYDLRLPRAMR